MDKLIVAIATCLLFLGFAYCYPAQAASGQEGDLLEPLDTNEKSAIKKREDTQIFNFPLKAGPEEEDNVKTRTKREARRSFYGDRRKFIGSSVYAASIGK